MDSGFRRDDTSRQANSWFVMPTKVGIQVFLMILLKSYCWRTIMAHPVQDYLASKEAEGL
jgi:hypothetical protein